MEKSSEQYFKSLSTPERITALRENAVEKYNKNVIRHYSEEELADMKHKLSDEDIRIADAEQEKKDMTKEINGRIKAYKSSHSHLLKGIRNKYWESNEEVYDLDNQDTGHMETYDVDGNLIGTRRLTPAEKQTRTFNLDVNKAG